MSGDIITDPTNPLSPYYDPTLLNPINKVSSSHPSTTPTPSTPDADVAQNQDVEKVAKKKHRRANRYLSQTEQLQQSIINAANNAPKKVN